MEKTMKKSLPLSLAMAASLIAVAPAFAHHSFAMFDMNKTVVVKGTISDFRWTNPHAWMEVVVQGADGQTQYWNIEMTSPNNLTQQGWKRTSLKAGDRVTVSIHPLRDGKAGGSFLSVVLPDGSTLKQPG